MDKRIAGLLGAAAALTTVSSAQATPAQPQGVTPAASYNELLDPVANALPLLKADDARLAHEQAAADKVAQIQVQIGHHHHHHHHHHVVPRMMRRMMPHHHHHHHHHDVIVVPH